MSRLEKEWEVKMELIASITQSQAALARILNSVADLTEHSPGMAKRLQENLASLTGLQEMIARKIAGISWRRPSRGKPGRIWLAHEKLGVGGRGNKDGQEKENSWTKNNRRFQAQTHIEPKVCYWRKAQSQTSYLQQAESRQKGQETAQEVDSQPY
ncbi:hypothetical protein ACFOQM_21550 [Paenibacillus sp. GCM10012307]|uniref:Uncharacterized protein n=1 Tax=Paenibacillus roseus TaxID=2798579 RepID=A0A934JAW8_9BACL|nr:hypothetical protein [Paenibacillus roseus]MBJ6363816.1 hypothetical protein [Paenibacillus roseus]